MRPEPAALGEAPGGVPLSSVVEALGNGLLEVAASPRGLDLKVTDPVIFDAVHGLQCEDGDLILGVGVLLASEAAHGLVVDAGRAAAAAVLLRRDDDDLAAIIATAQAAQVALVLVPATTSWGHLFTLLRTAIEAGRASAWSSQAGLAVGDLVSLANAVAGTVGGATTIEDPDTNVLAFSSLGHPIDTPRQDTILGHRVPGSWRQAMDDRGVFKRLYGTDDVIHVGDLGEPDVFLAPRLAIAVRAGGEVLGSIWVAEAERPFDDQAVRALQGAARIAALHMLHHRAAGDIERQRRAELIRALLEGVAPPLPGISSLGLTGTPVTVLAVDPELSRTAEAEVAMARAVAVITLYAEVYRRRASAVALDGVIYVLMPTSDDADRSRLMAFADNLAQRTQAVTKTPVRVGVGSTAVDLGDVHRSRQEADDVLRVLHSLNNDARTAHVDETRGRVALLHLEDLAAHDPHLRAGKIQTLIDHDRRRGTSHVETLRAYLDTFGDVPAAAARLSIHRNTFRYRLARLVELSGLDLKDADERLITHLQLRLHGGPDRGQAHSSTSE